MKTFTRFPRPSTRLLWLITCLTLLFAPALAHAEEIRAFLDSPAIPLGGYTHLNIESSGDLESNLIISPVDGLIFRRSGTSISTSIINGRITKSTTVRFTVLGQKAGTFRIPPIEVRVGQSLYQTQPIDIEVRAGTSDSASTTPRNTDGESSPLSAEDIHKIAFIRIEIPQKTAYVGQKVPVTVSLCLNSQMRFNQITQPPPLAHEAIMTPNLASKEYQQEVESHQGYRYDTFTWQSHLIPLKAGNISLSSSMEITVLTRPRTRDSFSDSFFDADFFGSRYQSVPMLAISNPIDLEILDLPPGAPLEFSGAIGQFELSAQASPEQVTVGDPITLHLTLSGQGNFERVMHNGLNSSSELRTYNPEVSFEATPGSETQGKKTFRQAVIPTQAGARVIPALTFSYFNPQTGTYESIRSQEFPIEVLPSASGPITPDLNPTGTPNTRQPSATRPKASETLVGMATQLDAPIKNHLPLAWRSHALWMLAIAPLLLNTMSLIARLILLRQGSPEARQERLALKNFRKASIQAKHALSHQDTSAFITHAALATRLLLANQWKIPSQALTSADAISRLDTRFPTMIRCLQLDEARTYAGDLPSAQTLETLAQSLQKEWDQLEGQPQVNPRQSTRFPAR
jgi:hypothetical protein